MTRAERPLKDMPMRISSAEQQRFWDEFYGDLAPVDLADSSDLDSFHPIYAEHRRFSHAERVFQDLIAPLRGKTVLTIGGGIDKVAVYLARKGNDVVSVDISAEASRQTELLGTELGLRERLSVQRADWEIADFEREFDVVIFHDSLHHMDCELALRNAHRALRDDGVLFAMEPICLLKLLREIHERFPFRPDPYVEGGEAELARQALDTIAELFQSVDLHYFDMLSRNSIGYFLGRFWNGVLLRALSAFDARLLNQFPFLRPLSSYLIVCAAKRPLFGDARR